MRARGRAAGSTANTAWVAAMWVAATVIGCGGGGGTSGSPGGDAGDRDASGTLDASGTADAGGGDATQGGPDGSGAKDATSDIGSGAIEGGSDGSSGVDAAGSDGGDGGPASDAGACLPGTTYGGGEMPVAGTKTVTAKIVDETGAPVSGQPIYICGIDICSNPGATSATGAATISTTLTEKKPAFKFGDMVSYTELAIPLTHATTDFTLGGTAVLTVGRLDDKSGAPLTPGTSATSGDVTVDVSAGATVSVDTLVYSTASQQELRTVDIPLANDGPVLASAGVTGFAALYGLAPAETPVCPAAKVTVQLPHANMTPNDFGWAPGAAIEFWIMTIDTSQTWAPYAGWAKMSDGVVSADGKSVSTVDGQGFTFLETFALRAP